MEYKYYTWYYTSETRSRYACFIYLTKFKTDDNYLGLEIISDGEVKNLKYPTKPRANYDLDYLNRDNFKLVVNKNNLKRLNDIILNNAYRLIHTVFTE